MRRLIAFPCADHQLVGTFDAAARGAKPIKSGLLIVSGGNEIRIGAHRGMALLAQRIAAAGYPVLRFDRRGIGDSTGSNRGFRESADDIAAAAQAFRREARVARLVGFGNCDAATALALFGARADLDGLMLANPWVIEDDAGPLPPPAAVRARYARKLASPREWGRLVSGGVDLKALGAGLRRATSVGRGPLAAELATALTAMELPVTVLTAKRDNTAIAFRAALPAVPVVERDTASHSFAGPGDADWLFDRIVDALR